MWPWDCFLHPQSLLKIFYKQIILIVCLFQGNYASLLAQLVKNLPAMQETWVQSLGWEDPLEKGQATHSSILA